MLTQRATWQDRRVLTTLLLVFLVGAFSGALAMRSLIHARMHSRELTYERLRDELSLNPQQADRIKTILDDLYKYNNELQTQVEDFRATGKNLIREILDPAQKKKFEAICSELQR